MTLGQKDEERVRKFSLLACSHFYAEFIFVYIYSKVDDEKPFI